MVIFMIAFIKRQWIYILLAAIATILIVLWFTRPKELPTDNLPKINKPSLPGQPINPSIKISITTDIQETSIPAATIELQSPISKDEVISLSQKLGFTEEPITSQDIERGVVYIWSNSDYSLTITPLTNEILYSKNLSVPPQEGMLPSEDTAAADTLAFVEKIGLSTSQPTKHTFSYYKVIGPSLSPSTKQEGDLLEVKFYPVINNLPVVNENPQLTALKTLIDKNADIVRFEWKNNIKSFIITQSYPLKNQQEINQAILRDGRIVLVEHEGEIALQPDLSQITLNNVSLGYLFIIQDTVLQPIYLFQGTGKSVGGLTYPVWIYLPAIKDKYFTESL